MRKYKFLLPALLIPVFFLLIQTGFAQGSQSSHREVCERGQDELRCHSRVVTDQNGKPTTTSTPTGLGPTQFRGAYLASASATVLGSQTIAIVDAYDHPRILSDLNTYSSQFGIPGLASCPISVGTPASPCFQKVDQNGGTSYPRTNSNWALEIALDVETAHAICQNCNILLVEAKSASYGDLMAAVDRAVLMGAKVVSNSYGSNEFSSETQYDSHFNKAGVAFTFSSGDSGYGTSYPAASQYVTANVSGLRDITSGSNGVCSPTYLCTGVVGFDGPTGLGSPNGISAF